MRSLKVSLAAVALGFFLPLLQLVPQGTSAPSAVEAREVQVTAKKYKFDPELITVKKGEYVRLIITALDRDHGFKLEAFGVNQKLKKGAPTTIEFTVDKAGTFLFQYSQFCGPGHRRMKGRLVVRGDSNR